MLKDHNMKLVRTQSGHLKLVEDVIESTPTVADVEEKLNILTTKFDDRITEYERKVVTYTRTQRRRVTKAHKKRLL
jgi:hypothetical protein